MSSALELESPDSPMEDAQSVSESVVSSKMSTSGSESASNDDSIISGHPDWLDAYPMHLAYLMDFFRPLWEHHQIMHDDLDRLGRSIISHHERQEEIVDSYIAKDKKQCQEIALLNKTIADSRTAKWTYDVELHDMRQRIIDLEVAASALNKGNRSDFFVEVHKRIPEAVRITEEPKNDLQFLQRYHTKLSPKQLLEREVQESGIEFDNLHSMRRLHKKLEDEQARFNTHVATRPWLTQLSLSDYKLRVAEAALTAANEELVQWRRFSSDINFILHPAHPSTVFSVDPKRKRSQSF